MFLKSLFMFLKSLFNKKESKNTRTELRATNGITPMGSIGGNRTLKWLTLQIKSGVSTDFTFNENITNYCAALSAFHLTYDVTDRHVNTVGLELDVSQNGPTVTVNPTLTLQDSGGNTIDTTNSFVCVTVLVWLGSSAGGGWLNHSADLCSANPPPLNPGKTLSGAVGALKNWKTSFASGDWLLKILGAEVTAQESGTKIDVSGSTEMQNDGSESGSCSLLELAAIAKMANDPGFDWTIHSTPNVYTGASQSVTLPFAPTDAVVLLKGFHMFFGNTDHHIWDVSAGTLSVDQLTNWSYAQPTSKGNTVSFNAVSSMRDENYDFSNGTADFIVIATQ